MIDPHDRPTGPMSKFQNWVFDVTELDCNLSSKPRLIFYSILLSGFKPNFTVLDISIRTSSFSSSMSLSLRRLAFLFNGRRPLGAYDGGLEDLDDPGVDGLGAISKEFSPGEDTSSSATVPCVSVSLSSICWTGYHHVSHYVVLSKIQTQFHKSWDTVQIVNKNRLQ